VDGGKRSVVSKGLITDAAGFDGAKPSRVKA